MIAGLVAWGPLAAYTADATGPARPSIKVLATDPTALEGGSSGAFTVIRTGDTNADLTVDYALSGTASNGVDYVRLTNVVILPAGRFAADLIVQPLDDGQLGKDKTVLLTLATNAAYELGSPRTATVTIVDNRFNDIPPSVNLISPTNGAVFQMHTNVTLVADAVDPDDPLLKVLFFVDDRALGSVTNPPYTLVWTNVPPGRHTLFALAKDVLDETAISPLVRITVSNVPPVVTLTSPTNGAVFRVPANIVLTANASDRDDDIRAVSFYANERFLHSTTNSPYTWTWTNVPPGHYRLAARATDVFGAVTESASLRISVSNAPPEVQLTSPTNGSVFFAPTNLVLAAEASDSDDPVRDVRFLANGHLLHAVTHAPYTWTWTNPPPGNYRLVARAADSFGAVAESAAARITVSNPPPVVALTSPTRGATFRMPTNIVLAATATDSDGAVRQVTFFSDGHPLHSVTNAPYTWTWTNATVGSHAISAIAEDELGATAIAKPVTVQVIDPVPLIQWITPTNGTKIVLPAVVPLNVQITNKVGQIAQVNFYLRDHLLLGSVTNAPYSLLWSNPPPGKYLVQARAQDIYGGINEAAVLVFVVTNHSPEVRIFSPPDLMRFAGSTNLIVRVGAIDQDGTVQQVQLFINGVSFGVQTNRVDGEYRFTWTNIAPATYTLTATATDNRGASSTSAPVHLIYATANVQPGAQGSLLYWPDSGALRSVTPDLLVGAEQTAGGHELDRAFLEFPLSPLMTSAVNATLVLAKAASTIGTNNFLVSYYPADLRVGTNDFTDATIPLTNVSAAFGGYQTFTFEVTPLVKQFAGTNLGFELALPNDLASGSGIRGQIRFAHATLYLAFSSNLPPVVQITSPTNNTVFPQAPASFGIYAEAQDVDGALRSLQFFAGNTLLGESELEIAPHRFIFPWWNVPAGTYDLTAKATDNLGLSTTSAPVHVVVQAAAPAPGTGGTPDLPAGTGAPSSSGNVSAAPASPVIESMTTLPDGKVQLAITGPAGGRIAIEASTNFTDWTRLAVVPNATGAVSYVDPDASGSSRRFYRVKPAE